MVLKLAEIMVGWKEDAEGEACGSVSEGFGGWESGRAAGQENEQTGRWMGMGRYRRRSISQNNASCIPKMVVK